MRAPVRPEVVAVATECEIAQSPLDQVIRRHPTDGPVITCHIGQTSDSFGGIVGCDNRHAQLKYFRQVGTLDQYDAVNGSHFCDQRLAGPYLAERRFMEDMWLTTAARWPDRICFASSRSAITAVSATGFTARESGTSASTSTATLPEAPRVAGASPLLVE